MFFRVCNHVPAACGSKLFTSAVNHKLIYIAWAVDKRITMYKQLWLLTGTEISVNTLHNYTNNPPKSLKLSADVSLELIHSLQTMSLTQQVHLCQLVSYSNILLIFLETDLVHVLECSTVVLELCFQHLLKKRYSLYFKVSFLPTKG